MQHHSRFDNKTQTPLCLLSLHSQYRVRASIKPRYIFLFYFYYAPVASCEVLDAAHEGCAQSRFSSVGTTNTHTQHSGSIIEAKKDNILHQERVQVNVFIGQNNFSHQKY